MYIYDISYMIRCIYMYVHICVYTHKIVVSVSKNWPQSIKGNATDTTLGSSSTSAGWRLAWWHAKQLMSTDAGGYVEPKHGDLIDLSVQCLNGEGCTLKLSGSCTCLEVYRMVSNRLPGKKGGKPTLYHLDSPLILNKELQVQGIVGKACNTFLHICSNRSLCCLVCSPRNAIFCGFWARACAGRGDSVGRHNNHKATLEPNTRGPSQAVLRAWHLVTNLISACKEWPCQEIFRPWHSATASTRAFN